MTMKEGIIENWTGIRYGLGIYSDNGAIGHGGDYGSFYTTDCMRYKDYDFVILVNGELLENNEEGRNPARLIFWNAVTDTGLKD